MYFKWYNFSINWIRYKVSEESHETLNSWLTSFSSNKTKVYYYSIEIHKQIVKKYEHVQTEH